jgi:hypothetical protein
MIIHHQANYDDYHIRFQKPMKYMDDFTFIPIKVTLQTNRTPCIFQTPLLFSPYGIQTKDGKQSIMLSFVNIQNDATLSSFRKKLENIYKIVLHKYTEKYSVNHFIRETMYGDCMRLKVKDFSVFDQTKQRVDSIENFSYGMFLINLHGLWVTDNQLWFQWFLVQAKIIRPIHFDEYMFLDDYENNDQYCETNEKYIKMRKMGVPKQAIEMQKQIDRINKPPLSAPPPPPPPPIGKRTSRITCHELQQVVLKKTGDVKKQSRIPRDGYFDPPSLEDIQSMLSKLKPPKISP